MTTLHTVNQSPFQQQTLKSCLSVCQTGDAILLIEEGVYATLPSSPTSEPMQALKDRGVELYALTPDLEARGLGQRRPDWIQPLDYTGFVRLSSQHQSVQSWY